MCKLGPVHYVVPNAGDDPVLDPGTPKAFRTCTSRLAIHCLKRSTAVTSPMTLPSYTNLVSNENVVRCEALGHREL